MNSYSIFNINNFNNAFRNLSHLTFLILNKMQASANLKLLFNNANTIIILAFIYKKNYNCKTNETVTFYDNENFICMNKTTLK